MPNLQTRYEMAPWQIIICRPNENDDMVYNDSVMTLRELIDSVDADGGRLSDELTFLDEEGHVYIISGVRLERGEIILEGE